MVRFPLALICAISASAVAVSMVGEQPDADIQFKQSLLITFALGLPLFIAVVLVAERRRWSPGLYWLVQSVGLVLLALYYFLLPENITSPQYHMVRFALLFIGLHFLVAWLPFTGSKQMEAFWEFNKSLFLRFLIAALYSAVLYIGIVIAMLAVDHLFGWEIHDDRYLQLWIVMAGIVNTWLFLAGIPRLATEATSVPEYPTGLKIFSQYVLLPLALLYFVILISFELKIIITWNWPRGWVSHLVLWYSCVGILVLLLLHPLRERAGTRWIQAYIKWFFYAMIPLVTMLFLSIFRRMSDYGVTINRYLVLAMAIGLAVVMLDFIFSRIKDIRSIPMVICFLAFLSAYGPWSAFAVSEASQQGRLEAMRADISADTDESETEKTDQTGQRAESSIQSTIVYLDEWHGVEAFSNWFDDSTLASLDTVGRYQRRNQIADLLGFPAEAGRWKQRGEWFRLMAKEWDVRALNISDYEYLLHFEFGHNDTEESFIINDYFCSIRLTEQEAVFVVTVSGDGNEVPDTTVLSLEQPLSQLLQYAGSEDSISIQDLTFQTAGDGFGAKLILREVQGWQYEGDITVHTMRGIALFRRR
jgi:hypothetical protein